MQNYFTLLKKYGDFSGRAERKEFWLFNLYTILCVIFISVFLGLCIGIIGSVIGLTQTDASIIGTLCSLLITCILLVPIVAVSVRRLHDTNHSGWWLLLNFVPFIGGIILFVFFVTDSEPGENRYGRNPKEVEIKSI